jgi:hypothetical protein
MLRKGDLLAHALPISYFCQREGMDLPEYQAMSALRDVALDGISCKFSNTVDQPQTGASMVLSVMAGGMDRPSRTKSHPARSLPSIQLGGPPCWASPLALGLIGF